MLIGGTKDEHFSYIHSSCQLGLTVSGATGTYRDLGTCPHQCFSHAKTLFQLRKIDHACLIGLSQPKLLTFHWPCELQILGKKLWFLNWNYSHKIFITMYSIPYTRVRTLIHLLARCSLAGKAVLLGPSLLSKNFPNFKLLECFWYDSKMIFKYNSTTISFLHIEGQRRPCTQVWRGRCLLH